MKRSTLGRALVGAILFLTLGGPAPGAVGSCGGEVSVVDAKQFCATKRALECDRARARGETQATAPIPCTDNASTPENEADPTVCNWLYCRSLVTGACAAVDWPTDCTPPPTELVTNACLNALNDAGRLSTPSADIAECNINVICPPPGAALTEALQETPYDPEPTAPATPAAPEGL